MLVNSNRDRIAERREATRREILAVAWQLARERGLAQLTLRDIAHRVGMRAPSLYSHFESKNAIYDAMFAAAWTECLAVMTAAAGSPADSPRAAIRQLARAFFDFSASDLSRYQLMNQRTIFGFEPSAESYAPAVATLEVLRAALTAQNVTRQADIDLYVAVVSGLIDAQLANDPGGDRWSRLLERAVDMLADDLGIPARAQGA
jgi:AcrR family transcriptional regulator